MGREPIEGTFRAHQVPIPVDQEHMDHADALLRWLKSYEPENYLMHKDVF